MYQGSPIAPITYAERVQRLPTAELYLLLSIHTRSGAAIAYQQNTLQLYHRLACIGRSRGGRLTIHSYPKSATPQLRHLRICPRRGVVSSPRSTPSADGCCAPATGGRVYLRGLHAARVSSRGRYPRSGNLAAALIGTNVCPSRDHIRRGRGRCHPASFDAGRSVVDVAHMPSTRIRHAIF